VEAIALHLKVFPSDDEGIRHLMKPEYHANPIDPAGSFVVTERDDELCDFALRSSGMTTTILSFYHPRLGSKGEFFLDVMISSTMLSICENAGLSSCFMRWSGLIGK